MILGIFLILCLSATVNAEIITDENGNFSYTIEYDSDFTSGEKESVKISVTNNADSEKSISINYNDFGFSYYR